MPLLPGSRSAAYTKVTGWTGRHHTHAPQWSPSPQTLSNRASHSVIAISPGLSWVGGGESVPGGGFDFFGFEFFSSKFQVASFRFGFCFRLLLLLFRFVFLFCLFVLRARMGVPAVRVWPWRVCVPWPARSRVWSWLCGRRATGLGDYLVHGCRRRRCGRRLLRACRMPGGATGTPPSVRLYW